MNTQARIAELQDTKASIDALLPEAIRRAKRGARSRRAERRHGKRTPLTDRKGGSRSSGPTLVTGLGRFQPYAQVSRRATYRWIANRRASDGWAQLSVQEQQQLVALSSLDSEPEGGSDDDVPLDVLTARSSRRAVLGKGLDEGKAPWLEWIGTNRMYHRICTRIRKRAELHFEEDVSASDGHDDSPVQQVASEDRGSEEEEPEEAGAVGGELWTAVCYRGVPFSELGAREAVSEGSRGWLCRIYAMASSRVGEGSVLQEPPLVVTGWVRSDGDGDSNEPN